jgi:signal transduction histidine kinase
LAAGLARLAGTVTGRRDVRLDLDLDEEADADPERRNGLLRITSEAITNAIRHGGASEIRIRLNGHDPLRLSIADNGSGFDMATVGAGRGNAVGLGLMGMKERAERMGASLEVQSNPGSGTRVEVALP